MTERRMPLTDDALRRALWELSGEPDANLLLTEVMRAVDATPQVRRLPWQRPRVERGVLLIAVLLATLGIGAAIALSLPRPEPRPTPDPEAISVPDFVVPFTYALPDGTPHRLQAFGQSPHPMYALTQGRDDLAVFLVTGVVHSCEDQETDASEEGGSGVTGVGRDPVAFLERLRDDVGVGIGPIHPTMLGNLPGVETEIDPAAGTCGNALLHEDGFGLGAMNREPLLRGPSTLIVARTGFTTIGVLISAESDAAYAEWLPIARQYVDSFVFETADDG